MRWFSVTKMHLSIISLTQACIFLSNFVVKLLKMKIIDTHAHIFLEEMDSDRQVMLQRAEKEGVTAILMPAIDSGTHTQLFRSETTGTITCKAMMGLHPCSVKGNFRDELEIAHGLLEKRSFAGIGEIGLDFYWDLTFRDQQLIAFNEQLEWALHYDLPVSIHSRNATDECIEQVRQHQNGKLRGVFHCFSGTVEQAAQITELGLYLGIGGVLTFKNGGLDKVMEKTGMDHIVLETDTPYLAPVPFRGKRNEPSYLQYVVEKLARLFNRSKEEVASITTSNAQKLFPGV